MKNDSEETKQILLAQAAKYPQMQIHDTVKLLYQNAFGCGHLVKDFNSSLAYIREELEEIQMVPMPDGWRDCKIEFIGNRWYRVYLASILAGDLTAEDLAAAFFHSGSTQHGDIVYFRKNLSLFESLCAEGSLPFAASEVHAFIEKYTADAFPPVHHSEAYRQAYHPAYRVCHEDFLPACFKPEKPPQKKSHFLFHR